MWHGRVIHPPTLGSTLVKAGQPRRHEIPRQPRDRPGQFSWESLRPASGTPFSAAWDVAASTEWTPWKGLPGHDRLFEHLREKVDWTALPVMNGAANKGNPAAALGGAAKTHSASYEVPYLKHAPIGPAVAVADARSDGSVTVHTNTQNPQFLRKGIATMLNVPVDKVVIRTYAGSGHYGRSNGGNAGPEDQAVLLSKAVGRPVRVQWMRAEDVQWSTQSSALSSTIKIGLDQNGRTSSAIRAITSGRRCRTIAWSALCSPGCPPWAPPHSRCQRLTRVSCSSGTRGCITTCPTSPRSATARPRSVSSNRRCRPVCAITACARQFSSNRTSPVKSR